MIEFVNGRVTEERAINEAEAVMNATLYSGLSYKITMGNILYWVQRSPSSRNSWIRHSIFLKNMLLKLKSDLRNTI